MKKLKYAPLILLIIVLIAFFAWRNKAPSYLDQNLHVSLDVGDEFEILMVGDMGSGDPNQMAVAQAMNTYCETHPLAAVIFLGDNFYPSGVVSVDDPQWQSKFKDTYGQGCLGKLPFYALLGNHDYKGNTAAQIAYHSESPSWNMPGRFYDINIGKTLQLTMIDTNIMDICGSVTHCTLDFMLDSLSRSNAPRKIVLGHHPLFSSSSKYNYRTFQGWVLEQFLCGRSPTYIAGHSHHLEHLESSRCPLDLFVVGGGGADLYEVKSQQSESKFAKSSFGFMSLKATPQTLTYTFLDPTLTKLYEVERKI